MAVVTPASYLDAEGRCAPTPDVRRLDREGNSTRLALSLSEPSAKTLDREPRYRFFATVGKWPRFSLYLVRRLPFNTRLCRPVRCRSVRALVPSRPGGAVFYQSDAFLSAENRGKIDAWKQLDAVAYYRTGPWNLQLNLRNLTDEEYLLPQTFAPSDGVSVIRINTAVPRSDMRRWLTSSESNSIGVRTCRTEGYSHGPVA